MILPLAHVNRNFPRESLRGALSPGRATPGGLGKAQSPGLNLLGFSSGSTAMLRTGLQAFGPSQIPACLLVPSSSYCQGIQAQGS